MVMTNIAMDLPDLPSGKLTFDGILCCDLMGNNCQSLITRDNNIWFTKGFPLRWSKTLRFTFAIHIWSYLYMIPQITGSEVTTELTYHPSSTWPSEHSKHVGFSGPEPPEPPGPPEDIRLQQLLWLPHRSGCTSRSPSEQGEQRVSMLNICLTGT